MKTEFDYSDNIMSSIKYYTKGESHITNTGYVKLTRPLSKEELRISRLSEYSRRIAEVRAEKEYYDYLEISKSSSKDFNNILFLTKKILFSGHLLLIQFYYKRNNKIVKCIYNDCITLYNIIVSYPNKLNEQYIDYINYDDIYKKFKLFFFNSEYRMKQVNKLKKYNTNNVAFLYRVILGYFNNEMPDELNYFLRRYHNYGRLNIKGGVKDMSDLEPYNKNIDFKVPFLKLIDFKEVKFIEGNKEYKYLLKVDIRLVTPNEKEYEKDWYLNDKEIHSLEHFLSKFLREPNRFNINNYIWDISPTGCKTGFILSFFTSSDVDKFNEVLDNLTILLADIFRRILDQKEVPNNSKQDCSNIYLHDLVDLKKFIREFDGINPDFWTIYNKYNKGENK